MNIPTRESGEFPGLTWGAAACPMAGETVSGDLFIVTAHPGGVLLGVVDGLGHGREAAFAAKIAVATLERFAHEPLSGLAMRCHDMMRRTRGAVLCMANVDVARSTMTWLGIGNADASLHRGGRRRDSIISLAGVVGLQMPRVSSAPTLPLAPGDTIVLTTDGIRDGLLQDIDGREAPPQTAERILTSRAKGTDDALVLVARFKGPPA